MQDLEKSSGQTDEASGESENKQHDNMVAYDSYKKVLSEKKNVQAKLAEYESKLKSYEESKMEQDGKQSELIQSLRSQLDEKESILKKKDQTYAWNTLTGQIKSEAIGLGCKSDKVDKLIRLLDDADLKSIEVDSNYNVNRDDVKRVLESAKAEVPEFFNAGAKIANVNPTNKVEMPKAKGIKDMTRQELEEMYKQTYKK